MVIQKWTPNTNRSTSFDPERAQAFHIMREPFVTVMRSIGEKEDGQ